MTEKLSGYWEDERVRIGFEDTIRFSGPNAFDKLDAILRRISVKRFEKLATVLEAIKCFGARIEFAHKDDIPDYALTDGSYRCYKQKDNSLLGMFIPVSSWIEIPIDRHKGWGTIEETIRHEVIHLLQDVVTPDKTNSQHTLLSDHVMGSFGTWLAGELREAEQTRDDDLPAFEIEAHTLESWAKTLDDIIREIQRKPELWEGKHLCHLID